jgi:hypothetical protein
MNEKIDISVVASCFSDERELTQSETDLLVKQLLEERKQSAVRSTVFHARRQPCTRKH